MNTKHLPTTSGIYRIVHVTSGRCYVGSALKIRYRISKHFADLEKGAHHSRHLQNTYIKYGSGAFRVEVLEHVSSPEHLIAVEQTYIDYYRRFGLFNASPAAGSPLGLKRTAAEVEKSARSRTGLRRSAEQRARIGESSRGRVASAETRVKLSAIARSRRHSDETRARMLGHPVSEETRAKIAKARATPIEAHLDGVVVHRFASILDAERAGLGFFTSSIERYLKTPTRTYKGYYWRIAEVVCP